MTMNDLPPDPDAAALAPDDASEPMAQPDQVQRFYVVSMPKFWIMYLGTFGFYGVYWNYRHWAHYKRATRGDEWPVMRAIFSVFFTHELFRAIDDRLKRQDIARAWSPEGLATTVVVFLLLGAVCDRLSFRSIGSPYTDYVALGTMPVLAYLRHYAQQAANAACNDPAGHGNARCTIPNFIWLALGAIFWLLVLVGLYMGPELGPE